MPTIESVNPASMEEENLFSENFENGEIHDDVSASSDDDDDDDNNSSPCFCTFPVTRTNPAVQPIYVCRNCHDKNSQDGDDNSETPPPLPLCICEACADACHDGHVVEYIATGPAYCDCQKIGNRCLMKEVSEAKAASFGIPPGGWKFMTDADSATENGNPNNDEYIQDVYSIRPLEDQETCNLLVEQAQRLVENTRDTHWMSANATIDDLENNMCELERLAWCIFTRHVLEYRLSDELKTSTGGAEWWVQVKKVVSSGDDSSQEEDYDMEAVDLHYDKDEELAEVFGLGSFPKLSTVTYLTNASNAAPTVVFPRTYHTGDEEVMSEMVLSRPRLGKHFVFDGRLLHGAPADPDLRSVNSLVTENDSSALRVTFLVNIWLDKKPSGVVPLPQNVRDRVMEHDQNTDLILPSDRLAFERRTILTMDLAKENDLPESIRHRIELPFVSKGATWVDDNKHDESNLVLVTFPPLPTRSDTARFRFGAGLQAYLDHVNVTNAVKDRMPQVEGGDYYV